MNDLIVTEYREEGILKGTLTHSDETIDGYMNYIGLKLHEAGEENGLVAIELRVTPRVEDIELLSRMMKMNMTDAWEYFLKIFPILLEECDSYRVEFENGIIIYHTSDSRYWKMNLGDGLAGREQEIPKGYIMIMKKGAFEGKTINLTKYLREDLDSGPVMNPEKQAQLYESYIKRYRDLFLRMKNGTMDNFLYKAKMLGLV